eukprot:scpid68335/ scgid17087/ 
MANIPNGCQSNKSGILNVLILVNTTGEPVGRGNMPLGDTKSTLSPSQCAAACTTCNQCCPETGECHDTGHCLAGYTGKQCRVTNQDCCTPKQGCMHGMASGEE